MPGKSWPVQTRPELPVGLLRCAEKHETASGGSYFILDSRFRGNDKQFEHLAKVLPTILLSVWPACDCPQVSIRGDIQHSISGDRGAEYGAAHFHLGQQFLLLSLLEYEQLTLVS